MQSGIVPHSGAPSTAYTLWSLPTAVFHGYVFLCVISLQGLGLLLCNDTPWQCPIACHCVSRSHELPDCYVILFGCYGTATHCYMLRVTELHMVATHPRFGACSWAQLAARMLVWLLCWSFEALAKGLELELGAESRTQPRQRWE